MQTLDLRQFATLGALIESTTLNTHDPLRNQARVCVAAMDQLGRTLAEFNTRVNHPSFVSIILDALEAARPGCVHKGIKPVHVFELWRERRHAIARYRDAEPRTYDRGQTLRFCGSLSKNIEKRATSVAA